MLALRIHRCASERCGRANSWSGVEEDLRLANSHTASKKENRGDKKEIPDAHAKSVRNTNSKEEKFRDANAQRFATTEKEIFTDGISHANAINFAAASQAKRFADSAAIRVTVGKPNSC